MMMIRERTTIAVMTFVNTRPERPHTTASGAGQKRLRPFATTLFSALALRINLGGQLDIGTCPACQHSLSKG